MIFFFKVVFETHPLCAFISTAGVIVTESFTLFLGHHSLGKSSIQRGHHRFLLEKGIKPNNYCNFSSSETWNVLTCETLVFDNLSIVPEKKNTCLMNFPFLLLQSALLFLVSCLVFSTMKIQSQFSLPFLTTKHCLATKRKKSMWWGQGEKGKMKFPSFIRKKQIKVTIQNTNHVVF